MSESSSVSGFNYRAFISYSHRDKTWGDWLHKALETYHVPSRLVGKQTEAGTIPRRLHPVFRDREELASATDLGRKVNEALAQSETMVVICSPASASSRWVNEEVLAYKCMGRGERIFCLIVAGEPDATDMPGREAEECFCPALRFKLDANGQLTSERTEPIAADAREGKDGKSNAKLKLIAGMLGVGFDALKQRELQRRTRRMTAIAALALIVMAATSVLAVYALISRHHAIIAQHEAVVAKQAAVRRQKQAEGLVGFMLGDLNDKLAQVDRLDIMQAVDDKAMAYFESLPDTDVTPEALAQRAKALEKIGSVRLDLGNLSGALDAYRESAKISSRLAASAPFDVDRQVAYSQTLAFIGMVRWNQGKLKDAQQDFDSARQSLQPLLSRSTDGASLTLQLVYLSNDIGHVLEARGELDAAEHEYRKTMALAKRLVELKPDNGEYATLLGAAHNNLGKMALLRGDLATAVFEYRADDAIEAHLSERDPKDNNQREKVAILSAVVGRTLAMTGDIAAGIRYLEFSVKTATQLTAADPHNTSFQEDVALYSSQLSRLQGLSGNTAAAGVLISNAINLFASLTRHDSSNANWQREYALALTERATQQIARDRTREAHEQLQTVLHILGPLLAKHPDERDVLLATMAAKLLLADVSTEPRTARSLRNEALETMQMQKTGKRDPRLLALQVETLLALGRKSESQQLLKQLSNSGYRDPALLAVLRREHIDYPANAAFAQRLAMIMRTNISGTALSAAPSPAHVAGPGHTSTQSPAGEGH